MRLMADERVYRQDGVTIGTLATRLGIPEYRLRRLISRRLGYRNFKVPQQPSDRGSQGSTSRPDPGGRAGHHDRARRRLPVARPVQRAFKATTGVTQTNIAAPRAVRVKLFPLPCGETCRPQPPPNPNIFENRRGAAKGFDQLEFANPASPRRPVANIGRHALDALSRRPGAR